MSVTGDGDENRGAGLGRPVALAWLRGGPGSREGLAVEVSGSPSPPSGASTGRAANPPSVGR